MTHVLVPVAVLDGETVPPGLIELLGSVTVTVLGYHEIPEQTAPDQARGQFEDRATEILDDICEDFEAAGATTYRRLVFTHDRERSIDRVAAEIEADAVVVVRPTPQVEEVYVVVGAAGEVPLVAPVLGAVLEGTEPDVFLRHFSKAEGGGRDAAEQALSDLSARLRDASVPADRIDAAVLKERKAVGPIVADAEGREIDLVVLSDPDLSIGEFILGDIEERLANQLLAPVLVVRQPQDPAPEGGSVE